MHALTIILISVTHFSVHRHLPLLLIDSNMFPLPCNPDRRALPKGWITRYDSKCVSTAPAPLPELTL